MNFTYTICNCNRSETQGGNSYLQFHILLMTSSIKEYLHALYAMLFFSNL